MNPIRPLARATVRCTSVLVTAIEGGLERLTSLVARLNERFEAHWLERTKLLRAHYARGSNRRANALPGVDAPVDLALRGGLREAA